jgi:regulator of sigma E protease
MDFSSVFLAALGIGLLIFLHELGHFLAARLAGVRVEVFSLGYGPRLFGREVKGTDFRVSLVPFGGYVMVAGADPGDHRYPADESLHSKSIGQRALFWSGGVLMNLLFALIVFPLAFRAGVNFTAPVVGFVKEGGAAWEARLQPGDRILAIGDKSTYSFENLTYEVALMGHRPVALLVAGADGVERTVTAVPHFDAAAGLYEIGIGVPMADKPPVLQIDDGGPAAQAGLRSGDELLAVQGVAVRPDDAGAFAPLRGQRPAAVALRVRSGGTEREVVVTPRLRAEPSTPRIEVKQVNRRIAGIRSGSPLVEGLGLQRGDVVLAIDGRPFTGGDLAVAAEGPERLVVHVLRGGKEFVLEQPADAAARRALAEHVALDADASLMLAPTEGGPAAAAGVRTGDRVVAVDGEPAEEWFAFQAKYAAAQRDAVLRVVRGEPPTESEVRVPALGSTDALGVSTAVVVAQVEADSPAAKAGILPGDVLVAIDGRAVGSFQTFQDAVRGSEGRTLAIALTRDGAAKEVRVAPEKKRTEVVPGSGYFEDIYRVGVAGTFGLAPGATEIERVRNPLVALPRAVQLTANEMQRFFAGLRHIVSGRIGRDAIGGPIEIARQSKVAWDLGWPYFVQLFVLISINLGILNLLPIPVLDGGQAVIYTLEAVLRDRFTLRAREIAQTVGLALLMTLMVFALYNDITKHVVGFFRNL